MKLRNKRTLIFFTFLLIFVLIVSYVIKLNKQKGSEQLNLKNISSIEILISDGDEIDEKISINDYDAIEGFVDYFNSIKLIEVTSDPPIDFSRKCIDVYIHGGSIGTITIYGSYLTTRLQNSSDRIYTRYHMIDSGYNLITDNSDVSAFLKELIDDYAGKQT